MSDRARELVASLADFRLRRDAKKELVQMGDEAVPALAEGLRQGPTAARWTMLYALEEMRSPTALQALVDCLDNAGLASMAADTLGRITGKSFQTDKAAWESFLAGRKPVEADGSGKPSLALDDEATVRAAVEGTGARVEGSGKEFDLTVPTEGGRRQKVKVLFSGKDSEDNRLVVIYTVCGPANPKNYEWALRRNLRMAYGAIGVRDIDGKPTFVAVNTLLADTLVPNELRASVLYLAKRADALEAKLTGTDAL